MPIFMPVTMLSGSATWQTVFSQTLNVNDTGWYTYCFRQVMASSLWSPAISGTKIRITFRSASTGNWGLTEAFIGERAAAGDDYDYASTPTRITFSGGSNGFTITNTNILSDEITFSFDPSKAYVVGMDNVETSSPGANPKSLASLTGATSYLQAINGDAATVNASGYSAHTNVLVGIEKIEVFG